MKRTPTLELLCTTALAACVLLVLVGCASPRAQLRNAVDAYAATLRVLADARKAGLIDDEHAAEIERWRATARAALDAWRAALEKGRPVDGPAAQFNEAMRELARLRWEGRANVHR